MLHPSFHIFIRKTAGVSHINFTLLFKHLKNLYHKDRRYTINEFSALIHGANALRLRTRERVSDEKLLAYYLYYKTQQQTGQVAELTQMAKAIIARNGLSVISDRYDYYKKVEAELAKVGLSVSVVSQFIMAGYFGTMDSIAVVNNSHATAVQALQLMQSHLALHCLITLPGGLSALIAGVKEIVDCYYEIQALNRKREELKGQYGREALALKREYDRQLAAAWTKMVLALTTMTLTLTAIIEPFISATPLLGIAAPHLILLSLSIEFLRCMGESAYHFGKWLALKQQADDCHDEQQAKRLREQAEQHYSAMKGSVTKALMIGISIGLMVSIMIAPNPLMVMIFAPLAIIGILFMLRPKGKKSPQHEILPGDQHAKRGKVMGSNHLSTPEIESKDHYRHESAGTTTMMYTALDCGGCLEPDCQHCDADIDEVANEIKSIDSVGIFHHYFAPAQVKNNFDDEDNDGDGKKSSDSASLTE